MTDRNWIEVIAITEADLADFKLLLDLENKLELQEPSRVHTLRGDEILSSRRNSKSYTARSEDIFDCLEKTVMPQLSSLFPQSDLELIRNHYDIIAYEPGGFFAPHVDHVPSRAPSVTIWHGLLCLAADECLGGCTAVYDSNGVLEADLEASRTPGSMVLLKQDVRHSGQVVTRGKKIVLKFDLLEVHDSLPTSPTSTALVCLECLDGDIWLHREILLKLDYFKKHLAFEKDPLRTRLGVTRKDCAALYLYLAGRDDVSSSAAATRNVHEMLQYMGSEEAELPVEAFAELRGTRRSLITSCLDQALLFEELARHHSSLSLVIILQRQELHELTESPEGEGRPFDAMLFDARGMPLLDTGGSPWITSRRSLIDSDQSLTRYVAGSSLLSDDVLMASSNVVLVAQRLAEAFVRRRLLPKRQASKERETDVAEMFLKPEQARALSRAALYDALGRRRCFSEDAVATRVEKRSYDECCNDGDTYSVSYYVTSTFYIEWLLWPAPFDQPLTALTSLLSPTVLKSNGGRRYDHKAQHESDESDGFVEY